jgi:hypothetical protein
LQRRLRAREIGTISRRGAADPQAMQNDHAQYFDFLTDPISFSPKNAAG